MSARRRHRDLLRQGLTYLAALISALVLLDIVVFIFKTGFSSLSPELLTRPYSSENIAGDFKVLENELVKSQYSRPEELPPEAVFSDHLGLAVRDIISAQREREIEVLYVDPKSPLAQGVITTAGARQGEEQGLVPGSYIKKLSLIDAEGRAQNAGVIFGDSAESLVAKLDRAQSVTDYYLQSAAGGIRGAVLQTLILIGLTLLFALPLGIAAAIYLHELAPNNRLTRALRRSIEILGGIPSIIFGLMGISLLYPLTRLFGITGQSALLGALTMSVILLPLIIRQTEEALSTVPVAYRMGALSLGASPTYTIFRVVLPNALVGILTASLLSIARVIGESAALIFTIGVAVNDQPGISQSGSTLAVFVWSVMSGEQPKLGLAAAVSIVILTLVLLINLTVKILVHSLDRKLR